jgi:hypothetical protein
VYRPHVLILPEDQADLELANGFHQQIAWDRQRLLQVLDVAGGWRKVLELFQSEHLASLQKYNQRFLILLIDFDAEEDRWNYVQRHIPTHLRERVFVIGPQNEPEDLKRAKLGSLEKIGADLAKDCREGTNTTWEHEMLRHNLQELDRMRTQLRPILF